jgi:hypothetical protein
MIGWLYRILIGSFHVCEHQWEILDSGSIVESRNIKIGVFYNLRCKKCGELTVRNLK